MNYWNNREERKEKAKNWDAKMRIKYSQEIGLSVKDTKIYSVNINVSQRRTDTRPQIELLKADTVSALLKCHVDKTGKITVHNYSSYKDPGGYFLGGSSAQEESLCMESDLYEIISDNRFAKEFYNWNRQHLNYALYLDRAMYTPNVLFTRGSVQRKADVITCAAPNWKACSKYHPEKKEENARLLKSRVEMLRDICEAENVDTFITGAWGCGVFGQDPAEVCKLFTMAFAESGLTHLIFAIPDDKTFEVFKQTMKRN